MDFYDILNLLAMIFAGIATAIPLVAKLIKLVHQIALERNWGKALGLVMGLMEDAEELALSGADKKAWVMQGFRSLANLVEYDIDDETLGALIDQLAAMSKKVNVTVTPYEEGG